MQKRLSHIAALGFLSFLLLPLLSMFFLQGAQWYLKRTADTRMEAETLITISVPEAAVHWEKKGKEISLDGKMFDIKSYQVLHGILTATGYYDDKETAIVKLLLALPHDKNRNILLHIFLVLQCFTVALVWLGNITVYRKSSILPITFCFVLPQPLRLMAERPPNNGTNVP